MRRLISMLAAGLLAAGTVLTAGGPASAGPTVAHPTNCTRNIPFYFNVTKSGVNYFLGAPNKLFAGAAVTLKPTGNRTTLWIECVLNNVSGYEVVLKMGPWPGTLALTTRNFSPGGNVLMEPPANNGVGFQSQRWISSFGSTTGTLQFQNLKTGLYLRVRNSGPVMYQTVTTGHTSTSWIGNAYPGQAREPRSVRSLHGR